MFWLAHWFAITYCMCSSVFSLENRLQLRHNQCHCNYACTLKGMLAIPTFGTSLVELLPDMTSFVCSPPEQISGLLEGLWWSCVPLKITVFFDSPVPEEQVMGDAGPIWSPWWSNATESCSCLPASAVFPVVMDLETCDAPEWGLREALSGAEECLSLKPWMNEK